MIERQKKIYRVEWTEKALKQLNKLGLNKDDYERLMEETKKDLETDPKTGLNVKKMLGDWEGHYRYRWGDYRIIYKLEENKGQVVVKVKVVKIAKRESIYD